MNKEFKSLSLEIIDPVNSDIKFTIKSKMICCGSLTHTQAGNIILQSAKCIKYAFVGTPRSGSPDAISYDRILKYYNGSESVAIAMLSYMYMLNLIAHEEDKYFEPYYPHPVDFDIFIDSLRKTGAALIYGQVEARRNTSGVIDLTQKVLN